VGTVPALASRCAASKVVVIIRVVVVVIVVVAVVVSPAVRRVRVVGSVASRTSVEATTRATPTSVGEARRVAVVGETVARFLLWTEDFLLELDLVLEGLPDCVVDESGLAGLCEGNVQVREARSLHPVLGFLPA
jgi:hypothetical protein